MSVVPSMVRSLWWYWTYPVRRAWRRQDVIRRGGRATPWPWTEIAVPVLRWRVSLTVSRRRPLAASPLSSWEPSQ